MNTLDNYIQEGILNRKNSITGTVTIEELKKYSYNKLNPAWDEGGVTFDEKDKGIHIKSDDKKAAFIILGINQKEPPVFNITEVMLPNGEFTIEDCGIKTTKGIFNPDCKTDIKRLSIWWNPNLVILEDLPQKVKYFDYSLGSKAEDEEDIDKVLYGIPKWCEGISVRFHRSAIISNMRKKNKDTREFDKKIEDYLTGEIIKHLDWNCPAAKYLNNVAVYFE